MNRDLEERIRRLVAERVHVVPYLPAWPASFERERDRLVSLLPPGALNWIEHFGSTAVPGLAAKPIVDVLAEANDLEAVRDEHAASLEEAGYEYLWRPTHGDDGPPFYAWFIRRDPDTGGRTHHVHVIGPGPEFDGHRDRLRFRDHLRTHPEDARAYAELKRRLAAEHPDDRVAYTEGKSRFIAEVTRRIPPLDDPGTTR